MTYSSALEFPVEGDVVGAFGLPGLEFGLGGNGGVSGFFRFFRTAAFQAASVYPFGAFPFSSGLSYRGPLGCEDLSVGVSVSFRLSRPASVRPECPPRTLPYVT